MRPRSPKVSRAFTRPCGTCSVGRRARSAEPIRASLITPETWVRDYIQAQRNHWPELEDASETLGGALNHPLSVAEPLRQRLKDAWGVEVRVVGPEELEGASQDYDPQRRALTAVIAAPAGEPARSRLAYQLALLEFAPIINSMLRSRETARIAEAAASST